MPEQFKTVSLKRPKLTQKEREAKHSIGFEEDNQFPYGTRIRFDEDEIDKIKALQNLEAGGDVIVYAKGKVTEVRSEARAAGEDVKKRDNVEIQLTDIWVGDQNDAESAFNED
jgi:hypothetical protein